MHTHSGIALPRELLSQGDCVFRFRQIGAGDEQFTDSRVARAGQDGGEVVVVGFFAVVSAAEDGVGEVDADLSLDVI